MIPPIEPAELSAYLDGELPTQRAREIRAALDHDPALRQSFNELASLDAAWKAQAKAMAFAPSVQFPQAAPSVPWFVLAGVPALFVLRLGLKTQPPLLGALVAATLLTLLIVWGLKRILEATDADRRPGMAGAGG